MSWKSCCTSGLRTLLSLTQPNIWKVCCNFNSGMSDHTERQCFLPLKLNFENESFTGSQWQIYA